ncbi:C-C motif chemokine 3-like [Nannospalax galili]|uniref:C-C motif chemokine n=1 Tax=Nannospalax galili TaxID=1026970 RepID=A0A8C6W2X1_NANGA|nr:C-C motif chemokine 3-like [Nannospalax galili]
MKVPTAAFAILFCIMALGYLVSSAPYGADTPTACCFSYGRQIPRKFIADYFETSSLCSQPGVIFLTKRDRQVCADPRETWVQKYVADLELGAEEA